MDYPPEHGEEHPTICGKYGELLVGGKAVGTLVCQESAGHDLLDYDPILCECGLIKGGHDQLNKTSGHTFEPAVVNGTPHRAVFTWLSEGAVDWPEALDPNEAFDVEVELDDDELKAPPVPEGLCGYRGCVFLADHLDPSSGRAAAGGRSHSWEN